MTREELMARIQRCPVCQDNLRIDNERGILRCGSYEHTYIRWDIGDGRVRNIVLHFPTILINLAYLEMAPSGWTNFGHYAGKTLTDEDVFAILRLQQ